MFKAKAIGLISSLLIFTSFHDAYHSSHSCFPSHEKQEIPIFDNLRNEEERTGLTEEEFNIVLDEVKEIFTPVFEEIDKNFVVNYLWTNNQVNATAQQQGSNWIINMYGGLARHKHATLDSFRVVACHEIGHHLGGAPRRSGWFGSISWASNEGQSDYYANFICMKKLILEGQALGLEVAAPDLSIYEDEEYAIAESSCAARYSDEVVTEGVDSDYSVCLRTVLAGLSLGRLLGGDNSTISLGTPDERTVSSTQHSHPQAQCRADTYMASSLCDQESEVVLDAENPNLGTCNRADGFDYGLRPLCWYKPVDNAEDGQAGGGWWLQASR
jgi:hypothetical protein